MPRYYPVTVIGDHKRCCGCSDWKPKGEFSVHSKTKSGLADWCKVCTASYHKSHYERTKTKTLCRVAKYRETIEGMVKIMLRSARKRSAKYNRCFSLTVEHIAAKVCAGYCERSRLPIDKRSFVGGTGSHKPFGPALDRADNTVGYTDSNTHLVCNMYNTGKGAHSEIDFIAMCCAVAEGHRDHPAVIQRLKELRNAEF